MIKKETKAATLLNLKLLMVSCHSSSNVEICSLFRF